MSFVGERERGLIIDLLLKRISEEEFYRTFPMEPGEGSGVGQAMLVRALQERDAKGVEFGLYLGGWFGISDTYLDVLIGLAEEPWHQSHEHVVDALADLKSPKSVETLARTATLKLPYRDYDEFNSLGTKCVYALRAIQTKEAISRLGDLMVSGDPILEEDAETQLHWLETKASSEEARVTAREVLAARKYGTSP